MCKLGQCVTFLMYCVHCPSVMAWTWHTFEHCMTCPCMTSLDDEQPGVMCVILLIWLNLLKLCQYLNRLWVTYVAIHVNANYGNFWPNFWQHAIFLIWLYLLLKLHEYLNHLWVTYVARYVNTNSANFQLNFWQNAILLIWLYLFKVMWISEPSLGNLCSYICQH